MMVRNLYLPSLPTPFVPGLVGMYYGAVQTATNSHFRELSRNVLMVNCVVNGLIWGLVEWYFDRLWLLILLHLAYTVYQRRHDKKVFCPLIQVAMDPPSRQKTQWDSTNSQTQDSSQDDAVEQDKAQNESPDEAQNESPDEAQDESPDEAQDEGRQDESSEESPDRQDESSEESPGRQDESSEMDDSTSSGTPLPPAEPGMPPMTVSDEEAVEEFVKVESGTDDIVLESIDHKKNV